MLRSKIKQRSSDSAKVLGDETFMSAAELRDYVREALTAGGGE